MPNKLMQEISEIYSFRHLLFNLIKSDIKLRYKNSFLGFLWHLLNPLFYFGILALVFSQIIRIQMENYVLFLFAGLVSWRMIQQTSLVATHSIVNNQELIKKIHTPKLVFPLASVISQFIDHLTLALILYTQRENINRALYLSVNNYLNLFLLLGSFPIFRHNLCLCKRYSSCYCHRIPGFIFPNSHYLSFIYSLLQHRKIFQIKSFLLFYRIFQVSILLRKNALGGADSHSLRYHAFDL